MNWVDTHAHIYFEEMQPDLAQVVARSVQAGVEKIVLPSVDSAHMNRLLSVVRQFPHICFGMIGLHPCYVKEDVDIELEKLCTLLTTHKSQCCAIGEIGLDFHHDVSFIVEQEKAFKVQLQWAKNNNLPISIHARNATQRTWEIVQEYTPISGVFHCFSDEWKWAKEITQAGMYLGIGGAFTYPKNKALREVVRQIGVEHIVLETDAPYLTPVPHRGKRNEPAYIPIIGRAIAEHLSMSEADVANISTANAKRLFGWLT